AVAHIGGRCKDWSNPDDVSSCEPDSGLFKLARALPKGTVDAIVGGHTHQVVAHRVNGVPLVQAGANGEALAWITLCEGGRVEIHPPTRIQPGATFLGEKVEDSPAVAAAVKPFQTAAQAERDRPLGVSLPAPLPRSRDAQSPLGSA